MQLEVSVIVCLVCILSAASAAQGWREDDRVLLSDVSTLTLHNGRMTNGRRSQPIPQIQCVGGSAGCHSFTPQTVQCYNRGSDGYDTQWECKTDMDNAYRFGKVEVSCEGYEYSDDPYVLKGSCGLEYTLDLTQEGYQKKNSNSYSGGSYGNSHNSYNAYNNGYNYVKKSSSWFGDLLFLVIVGVVIYAVYRTCIASSNHQNDDPDNTYRQDRWGHERRGQQPPPPGFRDDYMPGSDDSDCHSTRTGGRTYTRNNAGTGFGGFWGGAATGGILGYLLGNRGSRTHYHQPYARPYGGSTWGSNWGSSGWGSSGSSGWGSSGGSFSSGTRTASGFGGTKRR